MSSSPDTVNGVAVYEIKGNGSLIGTWSYAGFGGKTGLEWATGGVPGVIEGTYDVNIYGASGANRFQGSLSIERLEGVYQLAWIKDRVTGYEGIGLKAGDTRLAVSYCRSFSEGERR